MATDIASSDLEEFARRLSSDRLIHLYIGEQATHFQIQESVLVSLSEYFVKAVKNEHLGSGAVGTLKFPEDDPNAWKVLLYWKVKGSLPELAHIDDSKEKQMIYVKCWILGDKYDIQELQNLTMLQLLDIFRTRETNLDIVRMAFEGTSPGSALRRVMAIETLDVIYDRAYLRYEQLENLDGLVGITTALMQAKEECTDEAGSHQGVVHLEQWEDYMVGKGPKKHWVFEDY